MTKLGVPFNPDDPEGLRTFETTIDPRLLPAPDLSGGVQLADREGVFAHSFRCRGCTLHFVLFSWSETRLRPDSIVCPECRSTGAFLHRITQLSTSRSFRADPGREPEIYDVWPFRAPGAGSEGGRASW